MGAAKDLGVSYTDVDYVNGKEKFEAAASAQAVKQVFTAQEITALINGCSEKECIVESAQVKTYSEGVVEISGVVDRHQVIALFEGAIDNAKASSYLNTVAKYLPAQPSFYVKAEISGGQDVVVLELEKAKVAGFELSGSDLRELESELERVILEYLSSLPGTQIYDFLINEEGIYVDADLHQFTVEQPKY